MRHQPSLRELETLLESTFDDERQLTSQAAISLSQVRSRESEDLGDFMSLDQI